MKVCSLAMLMAVSVLSASSQGGDKKAKAKWDGTWSAIAMEQDGQKLPDDAVKKLMIKLAIMGDKYTVSFGGKQVEQGTAKADVTKTPITVDIDAADGPNKGKTIQAIVAIDGNSMKVCYNLKGKERPKEFATKEGSGHTLIVYEREKK